MDYNKTVHLPQTDFPMRAGLPKREPELLNGKWEVETYHKLMKKNEGKPKFVLHDGPPYANGHIHIGTALNKILKDIIIRYKNMTGFQAPYVPGWDTHGLPIESAILKDKKIEDQAGRAVRLRVPGQVPGLRPELRGHPAQRVPAFGRHRRLGEPLPHPQARV